MINLLHVDPGSVENGGVAAMISQLLKHLDPGCFSQSVWAPYSVGKYLEQRVDEGRVKSYLQTPRPEQLTEFISENRFDIALIHSGALNSLFIQPQIAVLDSIKGLPLVEVLHRSIASHSGSFGIAKTVAVSEHVASLQPPELKGKIETIYNGIELDSCKPASGEKAELRGKFGIPPDCYVVGFLGRLQEEKGAIDILKAAPAIEKSMANTCFVFAGDGPERERLEQYAGSKGINAIFTGMVSSDQKVDFLNALDVILVTSRTEGFPIVPLESIAAGVPMVAYAIEPIRELFNTFIDSYFLVEPGDIGALSDVTLGLLKDGNERHQLGNRFRELSKKFSIRETADRYKKLLTGVLDKREGRVEYRFSSRFYRYAGIMCLLKGDQASAQSSFMTAVGMNPGLRQAIENDIEHLRKYYRKYLA